MPSFPSHPTPHHTLFPLSSPLQGGGRERGKGVDGAMGGGTGQGKRRKKERKSRLRTDDTMARFRRRLDPAALARGAGVFDIEKRFDLGWRF